MELSYNLDDIKTRCVACEKFIEGDIFDRYVKNGNWCDECSALCYRRAMNRIDKESAPPIDPHFASVIEAFFHHE